MPIAGLLPPSKVRGAWGRAGARSVPDPTPADCPSREPFLPVALGGRRVRDSIASSRVAPRPSSGRARRRHADKGHDPGAPGHDHQRWHATGEQPRGARAATTTAGIDVSPPVPTGVTSAAARMPTTTAFVPARAAATPGATAEPAQHRERGEHEQRAGQEDRDGREECAGNPAGPRRRHHAEVRGEGEQRTRDGLGGAVARPGTRRASPSRASRRRHRAAAAPRARRRTRARRPARGRRGTRARAGR